MYLHVLRFALGILSLSFVLCGRLAAQILESDTVTIPVKLEGAYNATTSTNSTMSATITGIVSTGAQPSTSGQCTVPVVSANLKPGESYVLDVYLANGDSGMVQVTPPQGYCVYINGVKRSRYSGLGMGYGNIVGEHFLSLRVQSENSRAFGDASSIRPGRYVWTVGLGVASNGQSAGVIAVREPSYNASMFSTDALVYDITNTEVELTPEVDGVRQIYATQGLVEITQVDQYTVRLRFFVRSQVGAKQGDLYTLTPSNAVPLYDYFIEGVSQSIRVTRTINQGGGTRTDWTQMAGSNTVDWVQKSGSVPVGPVNLLLDTATPARMSITDGTNEAYAEHRQYANGQLTAVYATPTSVKTRYDYNSDDQLTRMYDNNRAANEPREMSFEYYSDVDRRGQLQRQTRPFVDTYVEFGNAGQIDSVDYESDWTGRKTLLKSSVTTTGGMMTKGTDVDYSYETLVDGSGNYFGRGGTLPLVVATQRDYYSETQYLTTVTKRFREDAAAQFGYFPGLPHLVKRPDGTMTVSLYFRGTFNTTARTFTPAKDGPESLRLSLEGTNVSTGSTLLTSYTLGDQTQDIKAPDQTSFYVTAGKSTGAAVIVGADGLVLCTQSLVYSGSAWEIVQRDVNNYVDGIFLASTTRDSGDAATTWPVVINTWVAGRLMDTTDEKGVRTEFTYNNVGRVVVKTRIGASAAGATIAPLTTEFWYDAAGHVVGESTYSEAIYLNMYTSREYDKSGRLTKEAKPGCYIDSNNQLHLSAAPTSYSYTFNSQSRFVTVTLPTGGTRIEEIQPDGRLRSVTGTGVVAEYYQYETMSQMVKTTTRFGSTSSVRKREQWRDMLGRTPMTSRPGFTGQPDLLEMNVYNDKGRLDYATKTGLTSLTLYQYDAYSGLIRSGLDVNGGGLVEASDDRIADSSQIFEKLDGVWWSTTTESTYLGSNSATAKQISKTSKRLTGLTATVRAETRSWDIFGNETRRTTEVLTDSSTQQKYVATTTTGVGTGLTQVEKAVVGLVVSTKSYDNLTYLKRYDTLGRLIAEIDPRTGTEANPSLRYTYFSNSNWVNETRDATNRLLSDKRYDGAGRVICIYDALGKTTRTAFTIRGEVRAVWGTATTPVTYGYNDFGDRTAMYTFRDPSNGSLTDSPTIPTNLGTGDGTFWEYDAPSGLLTKKTDAKGKSVVYTYNNRGQLATRAWARGVTTTYGYNSATGDQTSITYSDGTPGLTYTLDRTGRTTRVVQGFSTPIQIDLEHCDCGKLAEETFDAAFFGGRKLTHFQNPYSDGFKGRTNGYGLALGATVEQNIVYSYDSLGRFGDVTTMSTFSAATHAFHYHYKTNSTLIDELTVDTGHPFKITRGFENNRDLLTSIEATWSTTSRTKYAYTYDDRRQRQTVVQSGDVFNDYGGPDNGAIHQIFTYSARGELTGAGTFLGATATDQSQPLSARSHAYNYDGIGNRRLSDSSGVGLGDGYSANELNQYTSRTNVALAVGGTVADDSNIRVAVGDAAQVLAGRRGRHWGDNVLLDNWAGPWQGTLNIYAVNPVTGKRSTQTRTAFIPPWTQRFTYDDDGNVTDDGVWSYTWDAENRLVAIETKSAVISLGIAAVDARRLEFKYDYLNRRIEKLVRAGWNGSSYTTVLAQRRFIYDGWNLVAEYDMSGSTLTLTRSFTWGLDIVHTLSESGGVGALLQIADHASSKAYFAAYDGNGNVAALFDGASSSGGTCVAAYEYSPYGEPLRCEGTYAKENLFRFSTKFTDDETGLVYYGRRHYSPSQGRFLGRDAIEERGGRNLYAFTKNNPTNKWDYLGMTVRCVTTSIPVIGKDGDLVGYQDRTECEDDDNDPIDDIASRGTMPAPPSRPTLRNDKVLDCDTFNKAKSGDGAALSKLDPIAAAAATVAASLADRNDQKAATITDLTVGDNTEYSVNLVQQSGSVYAGIINPIPTGRQSVPITSANPAADWNVALPSDAPASLAGVIHTHPIWQGGTVGNFSLGDIRSSLQGSSNPSTPARDIFVVGEGGSVTRFSGSALMNLPAAQRASLLSALRTDVGRDPVRNLSDAAMKMLKDAGVLGKCD